LPDTDTCDLPGSPAGPLGARAKLAGRPLTVFAFQRDELIAVRFALMLL
jgi:hypothetical protein